MHLVFQFQLLYATGFVEILKFSYYNHARCSLHNLDQVVLPRNNSGLMKNYYVAGLASVGNLQHLERNTDAALVLSILIKTFS